MILTGKALEDFLEWYDESVFFVYLEYDLVQYALIIEWLDSVGIYVNIDKWSLSFWRASINNPYLNSLGCNFSSRQEATQHAIIKANEIYNKL